MCRISQASYGSNIGALIIIVGFRGHNVIKLIGSTVVMLHAQARHGGFRVYTGLWRYLVGVVAERAPKLMNQGKVHLNIAKCQSAT